MNPRLDGWENQWSTALGAYVPGERVILRGKDLFSELQNLDWMGLLIYGITGHSPDQKQQCLLSAIWAIVTSYPDPRLWNNRIGTLAGVARSTGVLGISAGIAISEAVVYGQQPIMGAAHLFFEVKQRKDRGETLAHILEEKLRKGAEQPRSSRGKRRTIASVPGYGRPVSKRDERIEPLMKVVKRLGFADRPILTLAFDIETHLLHRGYSTMYLNGGGMMAALLCDQGFTPRQQSYLFALCFSAGIAFCAADAAKHSEGSFFPLRCDRILCQYTSSRKWETTSKD